MLLPIDAVRGRIVEAIKANQVVIIVGETGSGKTTRIPVFLYETGFANQGVIGITEPRRIAATSVAHYVAGELGSQIGQLVGYQVRFDAQMGNYTPVKFMTDGILLREFQTDPDLTKYSVIMIDEAHERSQNIDFALGLLKDLLKRRPDLKVVVASATIDAEKFSNYFGHAPVVEVSGRVFPVEVIYHHEEISLRDDGWRSRPTMEFMVKAVAEKVANIHQYSGEGDILVFMSGKDEINSVIEEVGKWKFHDLVALPCYAGLSIEDQSLIFAKEEGKRKVVVATNIAETSITIDNIAYVVDSGLIKQSHFHSESGIQSLDLVRHSRAGCDQRKGRAGRTRPGTCYRMYKEDSYQARPEYTEPEIRRVSIAGVVLSMEDIGIANIEEFDFIDPPDREAFHEAYQNLIALGAIVPGKKGITELGRQMARLPLEPRIARMVLEAQKYGCVKEIATIASFLSVPHIYARPKGKEYEADSAHRSFRLKGVSDLLAFLKVWQAYEESGYSNSWCFTHYLNSRGLGEVFKIREQLFSVLEDNGIELSEAKDSEVVLKSVTAGLIYNLMESASMHSYAGVLKKSINNVFIHPGSCLFYGAGQWVVATEIVRTSKLFARNCTSVQTDWLRELLPHLFKEETVLVSLSDDGNSVLAQRKILYLRHGEFREVASREVTLTLQEARVVQAEAIAQAKAKGWQEVTFTREDSDHRFYGGNYRTYSFASVKLNVRYYCQTERWLGSMLATPKFQVIELPEPTSRNGSKEMTLTFGGKAVQVKVDR